MMTTRTDDTARAIDVCTRMFTSIDAHDWDGFERCLAPDVVTDFTALWGGQPERSTAHDLRTSWERLFAGFTSTQHLVGNYMTETTGSGALVQATFRATHFGTDPFGAPSWTLYGRYSIALEQRDNGYV